MIHIQVGGPGGGGSGGQNHGDGRLGLAVDGLFVSFCFCSFLNFQVFRLFSLSSKVKLKIRDAWVRVLNSNRVKSSNLIIGGQGGNTIRSVQKSGSPRPTTNYYCSPLYLVCRRRRPKNCAPPGAALRNPCAAKIDTNGASFVFLRWQCATFALPR